MKWGIREPPCILNFSSWSWINQFLSPALVMCCILETSYSYSHHFFFTVLEWAWIRMCLVQDLQLMGVCC